MKKRILQEAQAVNPEIPPDGSQVSQNTEVSTFGTIDSLSVFEEAATPPEDHKPFWVKRDWFHLAPASRQILVALAGTKDSKIKPEDWEALKAGVHSVRHKSMVAVMPRYSLPRVMSATSDGIYPVIGEMKTVGEPVREGDGLPASYLSLFADNFKPHYHDDGVNVFYDTEKFNADWDEEMLRSAFESYLSTERPTVYARMSFWETEHGPSRWTIASLIASQYVRETGMDSIAAWVKARILVNGE